MSHWPGGEVWFCLPWLLQLGLLQPGWLLGLSFLGMLARVGGGQMVVSPLLALSCQSDLGPTSAWDPQGCASHGRRLSGCMASLLFRTLQAEDRAEGMPSGLGGPLVRLSRKEPFCPCPSHLWCLELIKKSAQIVLLVRPKSQICPSLS